MKKLTLAAVSALALVAANTAFANDHEAPKGPEGAAHGEHHGKMFQKIDTDGDGAVSKDEWQAKGDKMFNDIDTNKDGKASKDEMKAHHEKKREAWKERREERKDKMEEHKGKMEERKEKLKERLDKHESKVPTTPAETH